MKKQILKKEKGITLIALVVTIVVLLILAGISLNLILGNNGLITKAKDAKTQTEKDQVNAEKAMNNLYDEMMGILGENGSSENEGEGDGTGSEGSIDLTSLAIGDLVNYTYDTVETGYSLLATQSGYQVEKEGSYEEEGSYVNQDQTIAQSSTTLQWQVLNIDEENGTIDLVSATPSDNSVCFKGSLGYNNGVYLLNNMCAHLYSNTSLGIIARSINLADTEKHLTTTGLATRNAYTNSASGKKYGETMTYTSNLRYPQLYATQKGAGIDLEEGATVTQPDLSGVDPYNESSNGYGDVTTDTFSEANSSLTVTQTGYYNITFNEANYGAAGVVLNSSSYYWVASRYADAGMNSAIFGLRFAQSDLSGDELGIDLGCGIDWVVYLRPVVSLSLDLLDGTKDESGAWNLVAE